MAEKKGAYKTVVEKAHQHLLTYIEFRKKYPDIIPVEKCEKKDCARCLGKEKISADDLKTAGTKYCAFEIDKRLNGFDSTLNYPDRNSPFLKEISELSQYVFVTQSYPLQEEICDNLFVKFHVPKSMADKIAGRLDGVGYPYLIYDPLEETCKCQNGYKGIWVGRVVLYVHQNEIIFDDFPEEWMKEFGAERYGDDRWVIMMVEDPKAGRKSLYGGMAEVVKGMMG